MPEPEPKPVVLTIIALAEAPPPEDSMIWSALDMAVREIGRRVDASDRRWMAPELLKLRYLTPRLGRLIRNADRAALLAAIGDHGGPGRLVHQHHHRTGLVTSLVDVGPNGVQVGAPFLSGASLLLEAENPTPAAEPSAKLRLVPAPVRAESHLPSWLEENLPRGGFDLLGVKLPPFASDAWILPRFGSWLPEVGDALTGVLWRMVRGETGRGPSAGNAA